MNTTLNRSPSFLTTRPRRLRGTAPLRDLVRETHLHVDDLVAPLFIRHGQNIHKPVLSMPGVFQISVDNLAAEIKDIVSIGIKSVLLFGIPETKDPFGTDSYHKEGIVQRALQTIRDIAPSLLVMTDVCFCEYTDHGHCGIINHRTGKADVDNDATLELLAQQALSHAKAGSDVVAPSGNIDGMVGAIRNKLDACGFSHLPILSYSVKYASALYGPFREAAEGAPKFGDRKTYQIDPANGEESLKEVALDIEQGADMLMVKPAGLYLDVLYRVAKTHPEVPVAAYHVSGEYALIKAAAKQGWIDEKKVALETLTSLKRAGARFIITYYAKEIACWI